MKNSPVQRLDIASIFFSGTTDIYIIIGLLWRRTPKLALILHYVLYSLIPNLNTRSSYLAFPRFLGVGTKGAIPV